MLLYTVCLVLYGSIFYSMQSVRVFQYTSTAVQYSSIPGIPGIPVVVLSILFQYSQVPGTNYNYLVSYPQVLHDSLISLSWLCELLVGILVTGSDGKFGRRGKL